MAEGYTGVHRAFASTMVVEIDIQYGMKLVQYTSLLTFHNQEKIIGCALSIAELNSTHYSG